jgi:protease I
MAGELNGKKVAILVEHGFEQAEMTEPRKALEAAGASVELISPQKGKVRAFKHDEPGDWFEVDLTLDEANPDDYDALELPGGVANPDKLRINPKAVHFVRRFFEQHKPVAVICHGPWTLIDADVVKGRTLTSWPSLKTDLQNAGAHWVDEQVVVDQGLVSSRKPDDLPAFNRKMIEEFREGEHARQEPAAAFAG